MHASWSNRLFTNLGDYTALSSFTSEASLMAGHAGRLPMIPAGFFDYEGKSLLFTLQGVLSSDSTPTYTLALKFHTSAVTATTDVSGTVMGVSAAMTAGSSVTNQFWELVLRVTCLVPGIGSTATSVMTNGYIRSGGLAAPYVFPIMPSQGALATWTQTLNRATTYYPNLTAISSASHGSNALTLKRLWVDECN